MLFPLLFPLYHLSKGKSTKVFQNPPKTDRCLLELFLIHLSGAENLTLRLFKKIQGQIQSQHLSKPLSPGYSGSNPSSLASS